MIKATCICVAAAMVLLGACAHDNSGTGYSTRGEPVGVNAVPASTPADPKSRPVTGAIGTGINPSPSAMATTSSSGQAVSGASSIDAGMGTSGSTSSR
jgi:hypothetical protein